MPQLIDLGVGSHAPILALVVSRTTGPVLECGTGQFSTPLLHLLCLERKLISLETDPVWLEQNVHLASPMHEFKLVHNWDEMVPLFQSRFWDVAFADHSPGLGQPQTTSVRHKTVAALANHAKFIVVHDTENAPASDYRFETVFATFKYRHDIKIWRPWTTILSNFEPFAPLP
jgi:hypothetical protein